MDTKQLTEILDSATAFAREHRSELAREIIEWHDTGLLCDGKLRELALIWKPIDSENSLKLAENSAERAALESIVAIAPSNVTGTPNSHIIIKVKRPEDYYDVDAQIVADDFVETAKFPQNAWEWEAFDAPSDAAGVPNDWRELCRRLYVELHHCDQQMRSTRDEEGEPHWTQSAVVRDVLRNAKNALDATTVAPAAIAPTDDARDAARYRWLREQSNDPNVLPRIEAVRWEALDESANGGDGLRMEALDAAIDAALQSHPEGDQP